MYDTNFEMKKARYIVVKKIEYKKSNNGIYTYRNLKWRISEYGIYAYTLNDVLVFITKEFIKFYKENNLRNLKLCDQREILINEFEKYTVINLSTRSEMLNKRDLFWGRLDFLWKTEDYNYNLCLDIIDLIDNIVIWNGKKFNIQYSYPVLMINKDYNMFRRQHRPRFHTRDYMWHNICNKRELVAGSDSEYSQYLTARQKDRSKACNSGKPYRKNQNNVPGDWKHYHKCRKQWAKNKENPSYEKLSRAVWEQEQKEMEELANENR